MARRKKLRDNIVLDIIYISLQIIKFPLELMFIAIKAFIEGWNEKGKEIDYLKAHQIAQEEAEALAYNSRMLYETAISKLRTLVGYTENKLYYEVVKTEFPAEGRIREYVNFYTYDRQTVAFENANDLINTVMHNVLGVYKGKNKRLHNTIVLDDYACDMKDLSRNIAQKLSVEEVKMVVA